MPRILLVASLFLVVSAFGQSQGNASAAQNPPQKPGPQILMWTPPERPVPPFGSQVRKGVVVVRESCKDQDGNVWSSSGTGFVVAYHDPRLPAGQDFDYLVTNRHVAECLDEELRPRQVLSINVQVNNLRDGSTPTLPLNEHGNASWYFPADDSIDLAVAPVAFSPDVAVRVLSPDMFFSKADFEALNIGEGAKIILSGYFYQIDGSPKLEPLVREGVLSMVPDTPLMTTLGKLGTLYLGDVHIFGGNSGSPVFISTFGVRPNGPILDDEFRFLGVVSGYYYEDSDLKLRIATTVTGKQRANSGVSMIVPADFLKDLILNDRRIAGLRDGYFAATQAKK